MASSSNSAVQPDIVVWEWEDDFGHYIPYDPLSCHAIENVFNTGKSTVKLGNANPLLKFHEVDVQSSRQKNTVTGRERAVKRRSLPATHALAQQVSWEWDKSSSKSHAPDWSSYSTDMIDYIERKHSEKKHLFVFPPHFGMDHRINLKSETQVNKTTQYLRKIKRVKLQDSYPISSSTVSQSNHRPRLPHAHQYQWNPVSNHGITNGYPGTTTYQNSFRNLQNSSTPSVPPLQSNGSTVTSQIALSYAAMASQRPLPKTPSGATGTSSTTSRTGNANTRKISTKSVKVPPCPPGGIPCTSGSSTSIVPIHEVIKHFMKSLSIDPKSTDDCAICQSQLTETSGFGQSKDTLELNLCKHIFHTECIEASYSHSVQNGCFVCPACNKMHGIKTGTQPPGTMTYTTSQSHLPGYASCGTLQVTYNIPSGIQTSEHPHPGKRFIAHGFPRVGYLPDNNKGRRILLLLIEAWKRRLIFTVGQSSTTGMDDCVTWTGIHHKTEKTSRGGHGYPDEGYLDRVLSELAAEGVIEEESKA
uniref:E3 ubiquitin-protein ligase DTX1-like isoform X2 n=1 Tax=Styela clava TaxID=7725 RepID=UPI0019396F00|nr:E3 ubiquitin-protein ligase DTX1-like isoform X2 [Styela clava]